MRRLDLPRILNEKGRRLGDGLVEAGRVCGFNLRVTGMPSLFYLRLADDPSLMLRQVSPLVLGWGSYGSLCGFSWRSGWGQI